MSAHDDRRRHVRARVRASATAWLRGTCKGSYLVENLSLGGIYLSGGPAIRPGTEVTLRLQLPVESVEVPGQVTRSERLSRDHAVAVAFTPLVGAPRRVIGDAVAAALESAALDSQGRPPPTVLVVDDSLLVRELLTRDIRAAGCEAVSFAAPVDAIDFLRQPGCCVRLALVDPGSGDEGRAFVEFLAVERGQIRRVLLADRAAAVDADPLAVGADAVLAKPWDADTLADALGA